MKLPRPHTLKEIAKLINCTFIGAEDFPVLGLNELFVVGEGDVVFVDHPKYYDKALQSKATIILINKDVECPEGKALLISDDPFRDFNKLIFHFRPFQTANSQIAPTAKIGEHTIVQPNCFIGNNVIVGTNCTIHSNVSIYDNTVIGNNVTIHAGAVLGGDAFYYKKRAEGYDKFISCGRVILKDNVDIGACCTIDKGVTGDTTINKGSKLDNHVHVGHDTVIGKDCLIAAHVGIAGCCIVEDNVTIWGQVGTNSKIVIGEGAVIMGQTGVTKSVKGGKTYFGTPITESRQKLKEMAMVRRIPELIEKIKSESDIKKF